MKLEFVSFSDKGAVLAQCLAAQFEAAPHTAAHENPDFSLQEWTKTAFACADALVFIGAVGIAVRAIAPYVSSKISDPAVVVLDECARFAIPILSGHLGGANALAQQLAACCSAVPVLTTATDANGVFAVDTWAKQQDCAILNPEKIKVVSAKLLAGEQVLFSAPWAVQGQPPVGVALTESDNCDIQLTLQSGRNAVQSKALRLVPRCAVLGIGCKKGTPQTEIEAAVTTLFETEHLALQALCGVCSIDLKKDEPGLLAFCAAHRVPFDTFTSEQLCSVAGEFSSSEFVQRITGVDNVCERSAVLGSGGRLIVHKHSGNGVTLAVALKPFHPNWRW